MPQNNSLKTINILYSQVLELTMLRKLWNCFEGKKLKGKRSRLLWASGWYQVTRERIKGKSLETVVDKERGKLGR